MTLGANLVAVFLSSAAQAGPERLLLCRPVVAGDPALARSDAVVAAARDLGGRFLDYGVVCDGEGEAARAARRAGLGHAVSSRAEGRGEGSRYLLVLTAADERVLGRRELEVAPGEDAVSPLRSSLSAMARDAGPPEPPGKGTAPWLVVGAGAAALAAGAVFAALAGSAAGAADRAATPQAYEDARSAWKARRAVSGVLLGTGAVAAAAGLAWRFAF